MEKGVEVIGEVIDQACYSFYRYEIKNGLGKLDEALSKLGEYISTSGVPANEVGDINSLLELILYAVEKKDFLIVADLLKFELQERLLVTTQFEVNGEY
jgi:hypothetical protein